MATLPKTSLFGRPDFWIVALVIAMLLGVSPYFRIPLGHGLVSLRVWQIVLLGMLAFVSLSYGKYRWRLRDGVGLAVLLAMCAVLFRSLWRVLANEPEVHFRVLADFTGAPAWEGATKTKGLVTALLLVSYAVVFVLVASIARHPVVGSVVVDRAARALAWGVTAYAALFLILLGVSFLVFGADPTGWPIIVRGIDVGHYRGSHAAFLSFGPVEAVTFATGSVLAGARAISASHDRVVLGAMAIIQALAAALTLSRAGWLALVIGGALITFRPQRGRSGTPIVAAATICIVLLIGGLLSGIQSRGGSIVNRIVSITDSTGGARLGDWQRLVYAFWRSPLVGYGAEAYRRFTFGFPTENFWLEVGVSGGLLALFPLVLAHARTILGFPARNWAGNDGDGWLTPIFFAFLTYASGTLTTPTGLTPIHWLLFGLTLGSVRRAVAKASDDKSRQMGKARSA
jgi:O-antigen ligase